MFGLINGFTGWLAHSARNLTNGISTTPPFLPPSELIAWASIAPFLLAGPILGILAHGLLLWGTM